MEKRNLLTIRGEIFYWKDIKNGNRYSNDVVTVLGPAVEEKAEENPEEYWGVLKDGNEIIKVEHSKPPFNFPWYRREKEWVYLESQFLIDPETLPVKEWIVQIGDGSTLIADWEFWNKNINIWDKCAMPWTRQNTFDIYRHRRAAVPVAQEPKPAEVAETGLNYFVSVNDKIIKRGTKADMIKFGESHKTTYPEHDHVMLLHIVGTFKDVTEISFVPYL